ncbi:MAG: L,D-transpeptidase [Pseudanabaenaceae cyanobacterium]
MLPLVSGLIVATAPIPPTWAKDFVQNLSQVATIPELQPQQVVRRAQLASALNLLLDHRNLPPAPLPRDVPANSPASTAIARLQTLKVLPLHHGLFQPDRPVTKGEALFALAQVLALHQQKMATPKTFLSRMYHDAHSVLPEQINGIAALTARGLVVNYPDVHRLNLQQPLTQAELIALIHQGLVQQKRLQPIPSPYVVNPDRPLAVNQPRVTLLVVHLTRRQLTSFRGETKLKTYPIAVGRAGWETPVGTHRVQQLIELPAWKNPFTGDVIPGGDPDNPLGKRWIGFWTNGKDWSGFHGTPNRSSVGQAVSHGCIRMYNEDIVELFPLVSTETIVRVVK